MNLLHEAILAVLSDRIGKGHALDRARLRRAVEIEVGYLINDRAVREGIEELRQTHPRGALIMSSSGWSGYWMAESFEEVLESYQEERARGLNLLTRIRKQRDLAKLAFVMEPQLELFS